MKVKVDLKSSRRLFVKTKCGELDLKDLRLHCTCVYDTIVLWKHYTLTFIQPYSLCFGLVCLSSHIRSRSHALFEASSALSLKSWPLQKYILTLRPAPHRGSVCFTIIWREPILSGMKIWKGIGKVWAIFRQKAHIFNCCQKWTWTKSEFL